MATTGIAASAAQTFEDGLFQVVAIVTTTGYSTADYEQWAFSSKFTLFMLMFFGGCAGEERFQAIADNLIGALEGAKDAMLSGELLNEESFRTRRRSRD